MANGEQRRPYRRIGRLLSAIPAVVIVVIWMSRAGSGLAFLASFVVSLWLVIAITDLAKVVTVSADSLTLAGYIGGPRTVSGTDAYCYYTALDMKGGRSGFEARFLTIRNGTGESIRVGTTGWAWQRRTLFRDLSAWLQGRHAQVDPDAAQVLSRLSR
jgi:hypothetical protein